MIRETILLRKLSLIGGIIILGWISLIAEPAQSQYGNVMNCALAALLFLSIASYKPPWKKLFFGGQDKLIWLYLLAISCGVFFSVNLKETLQYFYRFILPIPLLYFFFKNEFTATNRKILVQYLCLFSIIVALIGYSELIFQENLIYKYLIDNPYYYRYIYLQRRIMSTLFHPAVLGTYFIACLPLSFFLITTAKSKSNRIFGLFSACLCVLGTIFTFSRGSLLGILVLSCVYFWSRNRKLFLIFTASALIIIVSFCTLSERNTVVQGQRFGLKGLTSPRVYAYKMERVYVTKRMLEDHPFFGLGLSQYRPNFNKYYRELFLKETSEEFMVADNMYLTILGETGIAGFAGFMFFLCAFLWKGFRSLKLINDPQTKDLLIALIAGIIGLMVNMLTYDLLYWRTPLFIFWIFAGMGVSIFNKRVVKSE